MGLGIVFMNGKGSILMVITLCLQLKKQSMNVVGTREIMGKMMFALSFSMVFWLLSDVYDNNSFYCTLDLFYLLPSLYLC